MAVTEVVEVEIDVSLPSISVGMVLLQPFVQLTEQQPYRWLTDAIPTQLHAIQRTLDLAQDGAAEGNASFVVLPEYSVPGVQGITLIDGRVLAEAWPNETVVIAGVDGLSRTEYRAVCEQFKPTVQAADSPDELADNQWVNCCLIWVKDRNGAVHRWAQPKIRPSWPELNASSEEMFCGSTVYVFKCRYRPDDYPCRFLVLVCYDWVASAGGTTVRGEVLSKLNAQWHGSPTPLHWAFVIQHNPGVNHPSFLASTYEFLTDANTHRFVERTHAVVVNANTAVSIAPARHGDRGFSGCVFSPNATLDCSGCRPTVCMHPTALRGSKALERCKDVVFREMGECIHTISVRVPRFITPDATDRTHPLTAAEVHPTGNDVDPRRSRAPVPASVKWMNDFLDVVVPFASSFQAGTLMEAQAATAQQGVVFGMRALDGSTAAIRIEWAACSFSSGKECRGKERQQNVDLWEQLEVDALAHVVYSLSSLALAYQTDSADSSLHGTLRSEERIVEVVAIRGQTHQDCRTHYDKKVHKIATDPVLVVARDRENLVPTAEEFSKCYETAKDGLRFVDYQTLIGLCRGVATVAELRMRLDDLLPGERKII